MISEVLKARRLQLNKKPSEIASFIGVSESTYRDWEHGRKIQGEPYIRIADALEMSIIDLLEINRSEDRETFLKELSEIDTHIKNIRKLVI